MNTTAQNPAIGYVRVSTPGQAAEGVSLEAQQDRIRRWCASSQHMLLGVESDAGISGSRADNRPGLRSALVLACNNRAALVVYSLSRLGRSTRDVLEIAERLERCGADLVSLSENLGTTTASGKMIFGIFAVLGEFERNLISERTKAAMAHLRAQKKRTSGRLPYGYALDADGQTLVPVADEQTIIDIMLAARHEGEGFSGIARTLNGRGVPSKLGTQWSAKTVRDVVRRAEATV